MNTRKSLLAGVFLASSLMMGPLVWGQAAGIPDAPIPVELNLLDGSLVKGIVTKRDSQAIELQTSFGTLRIPLTQLPAAARKAMDRAEQEHEELANVAAAPVNRDAEAAFDAVERVATIMELEEKIAALEAELKALRAAAGHAPAKAVAPKE